MTNDVQSDLIQLVANGRRSFTNPISSITPKTLARQLADFRAGGLREFALTAEAIEERDDMLAGVIPKAKAAVARHGFEVCVHERLPEGMESLADRQKEALEHFYNNVRATSALEPDELGGFSLLVRQMMDAKGKRYSNHHIVWKPDARGLYTATMIHVPLWFFENRTGPLRFIRSPFGYDGETMEPGEWLTTVGEGVMRACAAAWMFKRMSLHSWVSYCEKHGFPLVLGKTSATKDSPDWEAMAEAVESISEDWSGVISQSAAIELIEAKGAGTLPYPPLVERMDRALARLWRGGDLGSMSKDGQAVGSQPQESETTLVDLDAATWISETLQLKLDRLVLNFVFGEDVPALAYVKVKSAPKKETDLDLKVDEFLLRSGHPMSKQQAAERYNRPLPPEDVKPEELLTASAPTPAAGFAEAATALNEATAAAGALKQSVFQENARREIVAAKRQAFETLAARLAEIAGIEDDAAQDAALLKWRNDLPRFARDHMITQPEIEAWMKADGAALVSGAAESAQKQKSATK
jgi:hypothetical protein